VCGFPLWACLRFFFFELFVAEQNYRWARAVSFLFNVEIAQFSVAVVELIYLRSFLLELWLG
jgi:hypothetical protein